MYRLFPHERLPLLTLYLHHHLLDNRLSVYISHEKELFSSFSFKALPKEPKEGSEMCYAEGRSPWKMQDEQKVNL
jgi:hypothetical protein